MSDQEVPRLYTKYHEICDRADFDDSCSITLDNFGSLIAPYDFPEHVICQVEKPEGRCGHKHLHGFLGRRKDGKAVLIGNHCARKYFNADENFAQERARVTREVEISQSLARLQELLADRAGFEERVRAQVDRLKILRTEIREFKDALPQAISNALTNMAKTGNNSIQIQLEYVQIDDDGKRITEWVAQAVGAVSGFMICDPSRIKEAGTQLANCSAALSEAELSRSAGLPKLKKWVAALSEFDATVKAIDTYQAAWRQMKEFSNLRLLWLLVRNHHEQLAMAKIALRYQGERDPSNNKARTLISSISEDIRSNYKLNFRPL